MFHKIRARFSINARKEIERKPTAHASKPISPIIENESTKMDDTERKNMALKSAYSPSSSHQSQSLSKLEELPFPLQGLYFSFLRPREVLAVLQCSHTLVQGLSPHSPRSKVIWHGMLYADLGEIPHVVYNSIYKIIGDIEDPTGGWPNVYRQVHYLFNNELNTTPHRFMALNVLPSSLEVSADRFWSQHLGLMCSPDWVICPEHQDLARFLLRLRYLGWLKETTMQKWWGFRCSNFTLYLRWNLHMALPLKGLSFALAARLCNAALGSLDITGFVTAYLLQNRAPELPEDRGRTKDGVPMVSNTSLIQGAAMVNDGATFPFTETYVAVLRAAISWTSVLSNRHSEAESKERADFWVDNLQRGVRLDAQYLYSLITHPFPILSHVEGLSARSIRGTLYIRTDFTQLAHSAKVALVHLWLERGRLKITIPPSQGKYSKFLLFPDHITDHHVIDEDSNTVIMIKLRSNLESRCCQEVRSLSTPRFGLQLLNKNLFHFISPGNGSGGDDDDGDGGGFGVKSDPSPNGSDGGSSSSSSGSLGDGDGGGSGGGSGGGDGSSDNGDGNGGHHDSGSNESSESNKSSGKVESSGSSSNGSSSSTSSQNIIPVLYSRDNRRLNRWATALEYHALLYNNLPALTPFLQYLPSEEVFLMEGQGDYVTDRV